MSCLPCVHFHIALYEYSLTIKVINTFHRGITVFAVFAIFSVSTIPARLASNSNTVFAVLSINTVFTMYDFWLRIINLIIVSVLFNNFPYFVLVNVHALKRLIYMFFHIIKVKF